MTRTILAVPGRAARTSFLLFLTLAMASTAQAGAIASRSNTDGAGVDGGADFSTTVQERDVFFPAGDFAPGAVITDVDITVTFEKIDGGNGPGSNIPEAGACALLGGSGHQGGSVWNPEIGMVLVSPEGTRVVLIEDDFNQGGSGLGPTYTSNTYGGVVTVRFTEVTALFESGTEKGVPLIGGPTPVSGTFLPVQPMFAFNGENPIGTWTLELSDSFPEDPLCSSTITIDITTSTGFVVGTNMTGSFGDPDFSGQGINTEILALPTVGKDGEKGGPGTVLLYWYTFDLFGLPIWAFGVGTIVGDTMVVNMLIDYDGNGPFFGPGFNPAQFQGLPFATVTIIWASCGLGTMTWVFDASFLALNPGFVAHTMNLDRITNVVGLPNCL